MKKIAIMTVGALAVFAASSLFADDSLRTTKSTKTVKKSTTSTASLKGDLPADRTLEVRVGPQGSVLTGDIRLGKTGTRVDIWDDLRLRDGNPGARFDVDFQPFNKFHFEAGLGYTSYDQSGSTRVSILSNKGDVIQPGANVTARADVYNFDGKLGYEVIKDNTFRVRPYIGVEGISIDGRATASGTVINTAGATVTGTRTTRNDVTYATFFGGVDSRIYISRNWYVGGDIGAFGLDTWYMLAGQAYSGYDFTKNLGVRVGYDYLYVDYQNKSNSTKADPLLGSVYAQFVWGF